MAETTLEALAKRVAELERQVADLSRPAEPAAPAKDWRRTVGMFADSDFMREVDAEVAAMREAERVAAAVREESEG